MNRDLSAAFRALARLLDLAPAALTLVLSQAAPDLDPQTQTAILAYCSLGCPLVALLLRWASGLPVLSLRAAAAPIRSVLRPPVWRSRASVHR